MSIEKYNKTGLNDAYRVLKHLEKDDTKYSKKRKGSNEEVVDAEEEVMKLINDEPNSNQTTGEIENEN